MCFPSLQLIPEKEKQQTKQKTETQGLKNKHLRPSDLLRGTMLKSVVSHHRPTV